LEGSAPSSLTSSNQYLWKMGLSLTNLILVVLMDSDSAFLINISLLHLINTLVFLAFLFQCFSIKFWCYHYKKVEYQQAFHKEQHQPNIHHRPLLLLLFLSFLELNKLVSHKTKVQLGHGLLCLI
jgi:hypothetical protein